MILRPLGTNLILKPKEAATKTESGFFLAASAAERPAEAEVVAVGNDVSLVKTGESVLYKSYATDEAKIGGTEYLVVSEDDILVVVEEDNV